jgi:hypothetical protein
VEVFFTDTRLDHQQVGSLPGSREHSSQAKSAGVRVALIVGQG